MKQITYMPNTPDNNGWKARHKAVIQKMSDDAVYDQQPELIARAIDAWCLYASAHELRYESPIGEDYVLGPAWADWGRSLRALLNGETGDLDCGTLDTILVDNLIEQGFEP